MDIKKLLTKNDLILAEAAIVESLRRSNKVELHPRLVHALLIYDKAGQRELSHLYNEFISVARKAGVPIIICSPTWRANKERLSEAKISRDVNKDAVNFMKQIRSNWSSWEENILIGGITGCKNDCYKPAEGISPQDAYDFHSWQINKLAKAGVDFLIAETLPAVPEAKGVLLKQCLKLAFRTLLVWSLTAKAKFSMTTLWRIPLMRLILPVTLHQQGL